MKPYNKKNTVLAMLITLVLASVAMAGCHESDTEDQFTIGSVLPLTGDLSPFGPAAQNAVNLAVQQVNAAGGVHGEDVRHVEQNSETREEAGRSAAEHLLNVERVDAIVGAMGSGITSAFVNSVIDAQIPIISPSNTAPRFTDLDDDGWYFRTVPSDALQGPVMADLLLEHGRDEISIIMLNNDYGIGFGEALQQAYEENGGSVAEFVPYNPEGADFTTDVQTAVDADPDAVVLIGYPDTGAIVLRNALEQGYFDDDPIPWYFSEGMNDQGFVTDFHGEADENVLDGFWGTLPEQNEDDNFTADFEGAFGSSPALFSDRTYDAAMLLMLAAEHCECTGGADIQESLLAVQNAPGEEVVYDAQRALDLIREGEDIIWTGASGPMEWDDVGDVDEEFAVFATWEIVDGEIVVQERGIRMENLFQ